MGSGGPAQARLPTPLPFYAILRSIPDKTLGILAMGSALVLLVLLPLEHRAVAVGGLNSGSLPLWRETEFSTRTANRIHMGSMALLGAVFLLLGFIGSRPVAEPYLLAGQLLTVAYFGLLGSPLLQRLVFFRPRRFTRQSETALGFYIGKK